MTSQGLHHFIHGQSYVQNAGEKGTIENPATAQTLYTLPYADARVVDAAVKSAQKAFPEWAATPPAARAKILMKFRNLIEEHQNELATLISETHGKSVTEALGSISRGRDVLDHALGIPHLLKGNFSANVGRGIDVTDTREPLGVVAGITPFNFPVMIPLWMMSTALACGNTFILKPSERNSVCGLKLAELALKAGLPAGVLNVIHGAKDAVNGLLHHKDIAAISFVGQTSTARYIQQEAIAHGKRVQAFGGAKNHMVIMPDADLNQTAEALVGAAFGSAGERCMAISVAVLVGDALAEPLITKIKTLMAGLHLQKEIGPLINAPHLEKVKAYVEKGLAEGAKLIVDGRAVKTPEKGHFLGPCLFDGVTPSMTIYQEEIFGPVLCLVRAKTYEEALTLVNNHTYANGVALFTKDGDAARDFAARVQVGMIGINVAIPVPAGHHSFGGWKASGFGDTCMHGMEGIHFFTRLKTITTRWPSGIRSGIDFSLPTHS